MAGKSEEIDDEDEKIEGGEESVKSDDGAPARRTRRSARKAAADAGAALRAEGKTLVIPAGYQASKSLREAFLEGFRGPLPAVKVLEPPVRVQEVCGVVTRVPSTYEMPKRYERQRIPCPECRAVHGSEIGQAVVASHSRAPTGPGSDGVVALKCRICGHTFKLPVEYR